MIKDHEEAVANYPKPRTKKDIQKLLCLCNWRDKSILNYSNVIEPFTKLLRKGTKIIWNEETEEAFNRLKKILSTTPALTTGIRETLLHCY